MKNGESIKYKGYIIKRVNFYEPYYLKDLGLFTKTLKEAKNFIDNIGKNATEIFKNLKI